ncbi:hypothetical protein RSOLAG22IIIB_12767 [Rhizoctonia solani]|uniref:Uncharacterized protein n=1 Tax=Rhizoctonia solani TaxID=456999 RepID=A0A0K6GGC7_9AGAM|nr:hypothetical protein RSOLAG22IIIB_12767 [Rhizoctonia solani]
MAKSSKQKPATGSSNSLSNAAKATQRKRVTDYKNSKVSAVASSVKGKGIRYYDGDNDDDKNDASNKNNDDDDDDDNHDGNKDGNSQDNSRDNSNKNNGKGSDDEDAEDYELPEAKCSQEVSNSWSIPTGLGYYGVYHQVAWCTQLKAKRGARKTAEGNAPTGKGKGKPQPSNATDQAEGSSEASNNPIEGSENETNDANKQDRQPAPGSDSPPGDEESTTGISGNMREATPSNNPTGGKRKTNATGKGKGKDKPLPLAERSPTPNPIASGSDIMEETEQPAKWSKKGRQAKQDLIDEVDGVVSPTTAPAKKAKVTQKRTKRT